MAIPLYDGDIPNSRHIVNQENFRYEPGDILIVSKVSRPTLTIFLPPKEKATGDAVIICPGGGYINLAMGYEGEDVARRFNESGIAAFVLKYRIPDDSSMINKEIGPLQDAQRAIMVLRSQSEGMGNKSKPHWNYGFFCRRSSGFYRRNSFSKKLYRQSRTYQSAPGFYDPDLSRDQL